MHFDEFLKAACPPAALKWRKYRRRAARHRIDRRLASLGLADYADYLAWLRSHPDEAAALADRMRVTVSRFFRDRQSWQALAGKVLPKLLTERPDEEAFRAWCVGCCGGEEPYTLALLWHQELKDTFSGRRLELLATDIDQASLARAQGRHYQEGSLRELPKQLKARCFRREGDGWRLAAEVSRLVQFRLHNFMLDELPAPMDLVCCRNLAFTYYRGERLQTAARRLWQALRPRGVLMIGARESLTGTGQLFHPWPDAPGIYRKIGGAGEGGADG